jgi:hypothetical protein
VGQLLFSSNRLEALFTDQELKQNRLKLKKGEK